MLYIVYVSQVVLALLTASQITHSKVILREAKNIEIKDIDSFQGDRV